MPSQMRKLPVHRGYPVPWFVAWLDETGKKELPRGKGTPDFRIMAHDAIPRAVKETRCWVCGRPIFGNVHATVIGPMCAVNRTSAEPPSHTSCADWSARACPFLARPHARRREAGMPEVRQMAGIGIMRNPGVAAVWISGGSVQAYRDRGGSGLLFHLPEPTEVRFYAQGRPATREEIMESIDSGMPSLREVAEAEGALAELEQQREAALELLPA